MSVIKGKIGIEDIELGVGTFTRTGKTGAGIYVSKVHVGLFPRRSMEKTVNYFFKGNEDIVYFDCTSGALTATLFPASDESKKSVLLYKSDSSENELLVSGTIEGLTNLKMRGKSLVELVSNGSEFKVLRSEGLVY